MGSRERDFIPRGACVDEYAEYFDSPSSKIAAQEACLSCTSLPDCQRQAIDIAGVLSTRGIVNPIVGGTGYSPSPVRAAQATEYFEEHGDATFRFNIQPFPASSQRQLQILRQARRSGQIYCRRPTQHPTVDLPSFLSNSLAGEAELYDYGIRHPSIIETLASTLLYAVAQRQPNGRMKDVHARYTDFDPANYRGLAHLCMADAVAIESLGIPGKRTLDHGPGFYEQYLEEGVAEGIPRPILIQASDIAPVRVLEKARALRNAKIQDRQFSMQRKSRANRSAEVFSANSAQARVAWLNSLHILELADSKHLKFQADYQYLGDRDLAALLHAHKLDTIMSPALPYEHVQAPAGDISAFVGRFLPYATPEMRHKATRPLHELGVVDTLERIRYYMWSGQVSAHQRGVGTELVSSTREVLRSQPGFMPLIRDRAMLKGLSNLHIAAIRTFESHGIELGKKLFASIAQRFAADVVALRSVSQPSPESVALYYDYRLYDRLVRYAQTFCPSDTLIKEGFKNKVHPLKAAKLCAAYIDSLDPVITGFFTTSDMARLAHAHKPPLEARRLLEHIVALDSEVSDVFSTSVIKQFCLKNLGVARHRAVRIKAGTVRALREDDDFAQVLGGQLRGELAMVILRSRQGDEMRAVQKYLSGKRQRPLRKAAE